MTIRLQTIQAYTAMGRRWRRDQFRTETRGRVGRTPLLEDRLATPEPANTILLSYLTVPTNNWASALKFTYTPPPENSLLAQIGDMATFMDLQKDEMQIPLLDSHHNPCSLLMFSNQDIMTTKIPTTSFPQLYHDPEECEYAGLKSQHHMKAIFHNKDD
ncbi:hypothetical protein Tco_0084223 [Tanacetum coccineum]